MILKNLLLVAILIIIPLSLTSASTDATSLPQASDIIDSVLNRVKDNNDLKKKHVSFIKIYELHDLDRSGNFKSVADRNITYHGNAHPPGVHTEDKGFNTNLDTIMAKAYDYSFATETNITPRVVERDLYSCYIIKFKAKTNTDIDNIVKSIMPHNPTLDQRGIYETAARMEGIFYIDKNHLFVRKMDAILLKPFRKAGIVMAMGASIVVEQERRTDFEGIVVLRHIEIYSQYSKFLGITAKTERRIWTYGDYVFFKSK